MGKYTILGGTIELSESEERTIEMERNCIYDMLDAGSNFRQFYSSCGNIDTILSNYADITAEIIGPVMKKHFDSLLEFEIYDISGDDY